MGFKKNKLKITESVIIFNTISMMNYLVLEKFSTKFLFHLKTMFHYAISLIRFIWVHYHNISGRKFTSSSFPTIAVFSCNSWVTFLKGCWRHVMQFLPFVPNRIMKFLAFVPRWFSFHSRIHTFFRTILCSNILTRLYFNFFSATQTIFNHNNIIVQTGGAVK